MGCERNILNGKGGFGMREKPFNFISFTDDELRLLVCIATSSRGWTDEQHKFMRRLEKELFDDE